MCKARNLIKYIKEIAISHCYSPKGCGGEKMSEFIWQWTKGSNKIYTKKIEVAERAMKDGMLVMGVRVKPKIVKY